MKNENVKHSLERELAGVHVSRDLKNRIMNEAAASRAPSKKSGFSIRPLAIAAAVMVTIGLSAGMIALRTEKPDLSATPLSSAQVKAADDTVWVRLPEGRYHASADCPGVIDPVSMKLDAARAAGLKGCATCIEAGSSIAEGLVWMMQDGSVYHDVPDCSGMEGALGVLEIEAKTLGKQPCMICLDGDVAESWPKLIDPEAEPLPTQAPGEYQTLPWQAPDQAEVIYAYGTPNPTLPPTLTPTPMPMCTEETGAKPDPTVTPMPTAMPSPTPEVMMAKPTPEAPVEEAAVWMTEGGGYFHSDEHCSGMENAVHATVKEAMLSGKEACVTCMERILWTADGGLSCHLAKNCSGMEDAEQLVLQPGDASHQVGCLVCAAGGIPVWMTEDGEFCHWDERCSGMENALQIMESEALAAGKQYCPVCLSGAGAASVSSAVDSEPAAGAMVWVKEEDELFYHTDKYCASRLTVEEFAGGGKKPCGACGADGLDDADMAYSDDEVYHAVSNCAERTRFQPCDLDKAEESGRAACPVCMREAYEQTVSYYTGSVWLTDEGEYYHRARNCKGLHGAYSREWLEAVNLGKRACQVCMNEEPVWINDDNPYYHLFEKCGYGQNDSEIAEAEALSEGRRPCPMCLPNRIDSAIAEKFILQAEAEGLEVLVGKEAAYHADESCSAIEADEDGHTIARETVALGWGKVPCDECLAVRYETLDEVDYIEIGQRLKPDEGELWMTEGGKFYHTDMHCSGMKNASSCDVIGALKSGKQPCPTCAEQFAEVWATENGRVYHLSGDCMGIVGAMKLTGAEAVQKGLTLCEVCLGELIDALNEGV